MSYIYLIPGILLAISLHEFAHGWVSWRLGDPTPKQEKRLTLNPLRHLDPIGAFCMLIFHMGWAKPVMINPYYYKNKRVGTALVSLAGPLMNILTGGISIFILAWIESSVQYGTLPGSRALEMFYVVLYYFSMLSINLAVFNLIPLPPLDGSKILAVFLPEPVLEWFNRYDKYFMIILLVALYLGFLDGPIEAAYTVIENGIWKFAMFFFAKSVII
ncbi:MAG: site-2 protease family protein [Lachnospiraceae bacterium]|nr:site-2 protease family protein [Lachnospiraceae bacterium]